MRTLLFRTDPVVIDGAGVVAALKDVDGASPLTLYVENMSVAASAFTRWGSKNANLRFDAVTAGDAGNSVTVAYTSAPNQSFSVGVVGDAVTVNLACDSGGRPTQLASAIMDLVNADSPASAVVSAALARGSDGSATVDYRDIVDDEDAQTGSTTFQLAGGLDSNEVGTVSVEHSATGWPDFPGPWDGDSPLDSDVPTSPEALTLASLAAESVVAFEIGFPVRGLRVKVSKGAYDSVVVVSASVKKKGGV